MSEKELIKMPVFFDEWVKTSIRTFNMLLGIDLDSEIKVNNQIFLIKLLLQEFSDPEKFRVKADCDKRLMNWITSDFNNKTSDYVLMECIDAIFNGYEVRQDDKKPC